MKKIVLILMLTSCLLSAQEKQSHVIHILEMDYPDDFNALMSLATPIMENGAISTVIQEFPQSRWQVDIEYEKYQVNENTICLKGVREIGLVGLNPFQADHSELAGICYIEVIRKDDL